MARTLPPLLSVRAFEAAARHGGFAKAAAELCVTPGAVAHQVKQLEEWMGVALFTRQARAVQLTEAGRQYWAGARAALEDLERASLELRRAPGGGDVTISAMPSLVTRWLMPRLGEFLKRNPDVEVRVLASVPPVDFVRDRVDLAIRLGTGPYPGLACTPLLEERFCPVASPRLLQERGAPAGPADLLDWPLLHDEFEPRIAQQLDWPAWFDAVGVAGARRRCRGGQRFSHSYLTIDAAIAGQGVALQSQVLVAEAVRAGQLVPLLDMPPLPGPYRFSLLHTPLAGSRAQVRRVADWLVAQAAPRARKR